MNRGVANPSYRQRTAYHAALLGGFALLVGSILVIGDNTTRDDIAQRHAEDLQLSLAQVIPAALHDNDLSQDIVLIKMPAIDGKLQEIYRARLAGEVTAIAFKLQRNGWGGPMELVLGIDRQGELLGVRILNHVETPGLGDKIEAAKSDWILGFNGRSLANTPADGWAVKKDGGLIDQFSGATITPRAVTRSIKEGLELFSINRARLFTSKAEPESIVPATAIDERADSIEEPTDE